MSEDIAAIALAGHSEAEQILAMLDSRRTEPQVASIALMLAAATVIGRIASDPHNLATMNRHMSAILAAYASKYWAATKAGTTMTRN